MRRLVLAAASAGAVLVLLASGCGSEQPDRVTVLAASSLTDVLPRIDAEANYSFDGSDFLASQVREDVPVDVYLSANARYPEELEAEGFLEDVRVIARNRLVIVVQKGNPGQVREIGDLLTGDKRVVVASAGVPVGEYTRVVLETLGASELLELVVSNESDVKAVVAKVALGEADAAIAYATDVAPQRDKVEALPLPDDAQPQIEYKGGVVASSSRKQAAGRFFERLSSDEGRAELAEAGFSLP